MPYYDGSICVQTGRRWGSEPLSSQWDCRSRAERQVRTKGFLKEGESHLITGIILVAWGHWRKSSLFHLSCTQNSLLNVTLLFQAYRFECAQNWYAYSGCPLVSLSSDAIKHWVACCGGGGISFPSSFGLRARKLLHCNWVKIGSEITLLGILAQFVAIILIPEIGFRESKLQMPCGTFR